MHKRYTATLVAVLSAVLVVVGFSTPAPAEVAAAPRTADYDWTVSGVVRDQLGRAAMDVLVEARRPDGSIAASSLTYEEPEGDRRLGFYRLYLAAGEYSISFSSLPEAEDPFRARTLRGSIDVQDNLELAPVSLDRARLLSAKVGVLRSQDPWAHNSTNVVRAQVTSREINRIRGDVRLVVRSGRNVVKTVRKPLTRFYNGFAEATIRVVGLSGPPANANRAVRFRRYVLEVIYLGSPTVEPAAKSVTVDVRRARR